MLQEDGLGVELHRSLQTMSRQGGDAIVSPIFKRIASKHPDLHNRVHVAPRTMIHILESNESLDWCSVTSNEYFPIARRA